MLIVVAGTSFAQTGTRLPMQAVYEHSAESAWAAKRVHSSRLIDDAARPSAWTLQGKGEMTFPADGGIRRVRVNVALTGHKALPIGTARLAIPNENWRQYNRVAFWVRTDAVGFPVLTMMVTLRTADMAELPEVHQREATNNVSVTNGKWARVLWEIPHLPRSRVTAIEFRPWVNKLTSNPWDRAVYEIRGVELQRVDADHYEGWNVAGGRIAFSHSGYRPGADKIAAASGVEASEFEVLSAQGQSVLKKRIETRRTRLGEFKVMDFSELRSPGSYTLRAGTVQSKPFRIGNDAWHPSIAKTVNFFYGERCGVDIPGVHEACHRDWQAVLGDKKIVMNGGWHDAGDLSQGLVNTGEATHAMFALAAELKAKGGNEELLQQLVDEARWGLDWIHKVRFGGGYRVGFASLNIWTNGIIGDEDDRTRIALNNPNVNYIAAAAGAAAYNFLRDVDPALARKSLAIAEEDWRHAIAGIESPETQSTPAFAATEMELASVGIIASLELLQATKRDEYARKAQELSAIVLRSQQREYVGKQFPLAGFFYTGGDRRSIFHQFHRANDQAPAVALSMLCGAFPGHPDWMKWYSGAALYAEYEKRVAATTEPYRVLPAYLYHETAWQTIAEGDRYGSSRESYRRQVLAGMPIGDGYYLRAFPVWFTRRGNYGVLLSKAKGLSAASRLRNDASGIELAERQLQWVVGANPFGESTMFGEGYGFAPQYSVSVGDLVGELPVGMMSRGDADVPYWPATNAFVFKEVWVHPSVRWLEVLKDVLAAPRRTALDYSVTSTASSDGAVVIAVTARGAGAHTFALRADNLVVDGGESKITLIAGSPGTVTWKARVQSKSAPWVAAVIADGDAAGVRDVVGWTSPSPAP